MEAHSHVDRRGFLTGAARLGAGAALFSVVPSWGQRPAPSNRIVMGCIGTGGMGSGDMGNFLGNNEVQVVAVCDVDRNRANGAKHTVDGRYRNTDCKVYGDFRELLARGDLDTVMMATPDHWHAITAIAAMKAGCDVYGEKPIAHSLAEGRAMADTQKRYGRIWQTGSWQRSNANFREGAELVRNGRIGKVVRIEVGLGGSPKIGPVKFTDPPPELDYEMWVGPSRWQPYAERRVHYQWRWQFDFGGGQMMDWIGHHGDIAHWGMGWDETGPVAVEGKGDFPTQGIYDAPTSYRFTCTYKDGCEMVVASNLEMGTRWIGEDGRWIFVTRGPSKANPPSLLNEAGKIGPDEIQLYKSTDHWRNFIDCVKSRQPTITPAETAHRSASIGHLGNIAMRLGRKLAWNPETEQFADDLSANQMLGTPFRAPWHL
jgi:predicted dehydrogenase